MESKLKKMQRVLSKKVKGSNNYKKLKQRIARLYDYISNCRKDANQKLSTILVNENQVISIEDLAISKMSRNHKLAKSLLDEGWYQFTSMLEYKMKWYGGSENQVISIEDLAISKMSRNHKLAKSLLDEGWYQFTSMLEYKMKWYGGSLVKIDRFFPSSKTCSACGCKVSKMPLNIREWVCPDCGCVHDRDINAAQNMIVSSLHLKHAALAVARFRRCH